MTFLRQEGYHLTEDMADQAVWEGHGRQQTADMRISGTTGWNLGPHQKWLARRGSTSTFQTPGFWSHSCRMDVNFPMGRCFFFSHFFTPGSVSQLSCSDVSGPFEAVEHLWPEAPWKSGGDCRSEGIFSCKSGEIRVTYATYEIA